MFLFYFMLMIVFSSIIYGILGLTIDKDDDHPEDGDEY